MYSPKISEKLIPKLYLIAKMSMTKLVNNFLKEKIEDYDMGSKKNTETFNEKE